VVFLKHARPIANNAIPRSAAQGVPPSHEQEFDHERFGEGHEAALAASTQLQENLFASDGKELRLFIDGFANLCTDVCMATGGVFGRFRERATVRAVSDIGAAGLLSQALFVADPHIYSPHQLPADAEQTAEHAEQTGESKLLQSQADDPEAQLSNGNTSAALRAVPHSYGFGEFLAHFYYLTKATVEEKLLYLLLISACRVNQSGQSGYALGEQGQAFTPLAVSPVPDVFTRHHAGLMTVSSLRSTTAAFFSQHMGVLRHIMPLMTYHRAREMREQLELQRQAVQHRLQARMRSPNAALLPPLNEPVLKPVDPAVTALALLGLLEGVLNEAETAIREAIDRMSSKNSAAFGNGNNGALQEQQQPPSLPIEQWVSEWSAQAELLALVSVPGLATLIQIHSVVPVEAYDAAQQTRTQENTTSGAVRSTP